MPSRLEWLIIVLSVVFTPEALREGLTLIGASPGGGRSNKGDHGGGRRSHSSQVMSIPMNRGSTKGQCSETQLGMSTLSDDTRGVEARSSTTHQLMSRVGPDSSRWVEVDATREALLCLVQHGIVE